MSPHREYVIVSIENGAEADFEKFERCMGMPLAANDTAELEGSWWFAATAPDGTIRRAFTFQSWDRADLGGLIGHLGTPSVRLTIGYVDLTPFRAEGPGAANITRIKPPMLRPAMIDAIYRVTGRRRSK